MSKVVAEEEELEEEEQEEDSLDNADASKKRPMSLSGKGLMPPPVETAAATKKKKPRTMRPTESIKRENLIAANAKQEVARQELEKAITTAVAKTFKQTFDKEIKVPRKLILEGGVQYRTHGAIMKYSNYRKVLNEQLYDNRTSLSVDFFCQEYQNGGREAIRRLTITGHLGYVRPEHQPPPQGYRREDLYSIIYVGEHSIQSQEGFDALHKFMARDDAVKQVTDAFQRRYIIVVFLSELAEFLAYSSVELDKRNIPADDCMYDDDVRYFLNNCIKN